MLPGRYHTPAGNHRPEPHRLIKLIMGLANIFQPLIDIFGPVLVVLSRHHRRLVALVHHRADRRRPRSAPASPSR
jgi:hypothetical protein